MSRTLDSKEKPSDAAASSAHRALSSMIDSGRSFSGQERNSVFLNTRDGRFANLSAGSGLDFPDDGRALAMCDWDQDGDLDLWISNRNAPRLRLLLNGSSQNYQFLSLRLEGNGTSVNRDAIGARVEVILPSGNPHRLTRSLRAGEGFLSQSSKWLHFGLGEITDISAIRVRWPDGTLESFPGIDANRRYALLQSSGIARQISIPERKIALVPGAQSPTPSSTRARIPVVTHLRAPKLNARNNQGQQPALGKQSLLVNLWATWCAPCLEELRQHRDRANDLQAAGLQVLALSVDDLDPEAAGDPSKVIRQMQFPFPSGKAPAPLVAAFQEFHDHLVGLNRPLPVPTSFLIEPGGHISVIYKGPLEIDQLLQDLTHSSGSLDERLQRAAQLPGSQLSHPVVARRRLTQESSTQFRYGLARRADNDLEGAAYFLSAARQLDPSYAPAARELASLHLSRKQWADAHLELQAYLQLQDRDAVAHREMALLEARLGQREKALSHFETALQINPDDALAHFQFAAFLAPRDPAAAVSHYREGLRLQPRNQIAANNLAWLLATQPGKVQNAVEALEIAQRIDRESGGKTPNLLDTLAAAQAATGDFPAAVATIQKALPLARDTNNKQLMEGLTARLKLYLEKKPYLESRPVNNPN